MTHLVNNMDASQSSLPAHFYSNIEVADEKYNSELSSPASGSRFIEHQDWGFSTEEQLEVSHAYFLEPSLETLLT